MTTKIEQAVAVTLELAEFAANQTLRENNIEFTMRFNITEEAIVNSIRELQRDQERLDFFLNERLCIIEENGTFQIWRYEFDGSSTQRSDKTKTFFTPREAIDSAMLLTFLVENCSMQIDVEGKSN